MSVALVVVELSRDSGVVCSKSPCGSESVEIFAIACPLVKVLPNGCVISGKMCHNCHGWGLSRDLF